MKVLSRH